MKFGAWRCGNCGNIYNTLELARLEKVKAVESDTDPNNQHGFTPVCTCGYRFHLDKFRIHDNLKIKINSEDRDVLVSTVDLELNHGYNKDLWYETMIFVEDAEGKDKIECDYENRYETKNEAIEDHNRLLKLLKDGKYAIEDINNKKVLHITEI